MYHNYNYNQCNRYIQITIFCIDFVTENTLLVLNTKSFKYNIYLLVNLLIIYFVCPIQIDVLQLLYFSFSFSIATVIFSVPRGRLLLQKPFDYLSDLCQTHLLTYSKIFCYPCVTLNVIKYCYGVW